MNFNFMAVRCGDTTTQILKNFMEEIGYELADLHVHPPPPQIKNNDQVLVNFFHMGV